MQQTSTVGLHGVRPHTISAAPASARFPASAGVPLDAVPLDAPLDASLSPDDADPEEATLPDDPEPDELVSPEAPVPLVALPELEPDAVDEPEPPDEPCEPEPEDPEESMAASSELFPLELDPPHPTAIANPKAMHSAETF
jgi:hypothetical protein